MAESNAYSNKSNYTPYKHTTDEILWNGGEIPCLGICNNITLTQLETDIANKVCELIELTDATDLVLPDCLIVSWQTRDKTVLEFIKFLLDEYCTQQAVNAQLQDEINTVNPQITLEYCCCNEASGCGTSVTLTLSDHLQKILNCLCEQAARITTLENSFNTLNSQLNAPGGLVDQLNSVKTNADNWIANKPGIQSQLTLPLTLI